MSERSFHTPSTLPWYAERPASAAVRAGDLVFISGQCALDESGAVEAPGDVRAQARAAFGRLQELVALAGGGMEDIVDLISFHTDPRGIDAVFEVARDFLPGSYPAWTQVGTTGLPAPGLLVSIRAIAHVGRESKRCFTPGSLAWCDALPMSAGCRKGNLIFVSGQLAADADCHVKVPGNHAAQARFGFNRIREIITHLGGTLDDVISFHQDARGMVDAGGVQRATFEHVPKDQLAAWTAIGATGFSKLGMLSSWRAIADVTPGPWLSKTPESIW